MNLGVVGLGSMGMNHVRVCSKLGALAAMADPSPAAREAAGRLYEAPRHADPDAILRDPDIDGVILATPTSYHRDLALRAIEAGKHVLVEKPIAGTVAEARELVEAAADTGLVFAVGHIERHNPVVKYAHQTLASGQLGELLSISARRVSSFPGRIRDVGCIMDIGIHEIDIVRYLTGSEVVQVHANAGCHRANGHEDHALVMLRCANGASAAIETNWMTPMRVRKNTITCTEGLVELDYMEQIATMSRARYSASGGPVVYQAPIEYHDQRVVLQRQEPLYNELSDFLEAIEQKRPPLVTGEDGLRALEVAQAAIQSYRQGRQIDLNEDLASTSVVHLRELADRPERRASAGTGRSA